MKQNLAVLYAVVGLGDWEPEFAFDVRHQKRPPAPRRKSVILSSNL
jgi:hypothetical protein